MHSYKQRVARAFNRAAQSYDAAADLQHGVGAQLIRLVSPYVAQDAQCADIGAGTGLFAVALSELCCHGRYFFVDLAFDMLQLTQARKITSLNTGVCADFDALPFFSNQLDFIFSNMCLQWSPNLTKTLLELLRVIKPGGVVAVALLTDGTLGELSETFARVRGYSPINIFCKTHVLESMIQALPVELTHFSNHREKKHFAGFVDLIKFLKKTGANYSIERSLPMTFTLWNQLEKYYKAHFLYGEKIQATFDISYLILRKKIC